MTTIEWTQRPGTKGESWNPIRARHRETGKVGWLCVHASEGCRNCYAEAMNRWRGNGVSYREQDRAKVEIFLDEKALLKPLTWRKPRTVFVCSMTDLFDRGHNREMIDRIFAVMALCPQHTFQVLTKRPERMSRYVAWATMPRMARAMAQIPRQYGPPGLSVEWPLPNLWIGTSVEDQKTADRRAPELLKTFAALRFLSVEPLLAPVDLSPLLEGIDWVIVGGESGPKARPMHPDWVRRIRDACQAAGVPFFFKQWGAWAPGECIDGPQTRTETGATFFGGRWIFEDVTPKMGSELHFEDAPDVWRVGKKRGGHLLDGREWREFPA